MKTLLLLFLGMVVLQPCYATVHSHELWINNGISNIVDDPEIPYMVFNSSSDFEINNTVLSVNIGDTIAFTIHNNDTLTHGFNIKNITLDGGPYIIAPGDFIEVEVAFEDYGAFIYYDDFNYPHYKSLGAAGIIMVSNTSYPVFYWNMKEHDKAWNENVTAGVLDPISEYDPLYFTINGLNNPETQDDPVSKIVGNVNDTLIVCMTNTGQMTHSIHLHGYHATVKYSSSNPNHVNREKDTFPIAAMETLILYIVPDKPGIYPVHDHNLVATSGNGIYANGMFQIIVISE